MIRRTVLKMLGAVPVVAPQAVKEVLSPVSYPLGGASGGLSPMVDAATASTPNRAISQLEANKRHNIILKWVRSRQGYIDELRDVISRETKVTYIDPDLMAMRSLSQAARIYYMRQRMINQRMDAELSDDNRSIWRVTEKWIERANKFLDGDKKR